MNESEWNVIAVTALDIGCDCKKEFQVRSKSLRGAAVKAENKIKKEMGDSWQIRSIWWLDSNRSKVGNSK